MSDATPQKPRGRPLRGAKDGKPFKKGEDQSHLNEAKRMGWSKKKLLKDLLNITTNGKLGNSNTDYRKLTAEFLGIKEEHVTIKMIMEFRQIEKAILKGDTPAFAAIMDRAFGKPPQQVELFGADGKDLFPRPKMKLPDGTEIEL